MLKMKKKCVENEMDVDIIVHDQCSKNLRLISQK